MRYTDKLKRFIPLFPAFLLCVLATYVAPAQSSEPVDPKRGSAAGASYSLSDIENINLTNGNLSLNMPLVTLPKSRGGLGASMGFMYNSKIYKPVVEDIVVGIEHTDQNLLYNGDSGGWRRSSSLSFELKVTNRFATLPPVECVAGMQSQYEKNAYSWKVQVIMPDGSEQDFRPVGYADIYDDGFFKIGPNGRGRTASFSTCSVTEGVVTTSPVAYYSADGSHIRMLVSPADESFTMYFPDGSYFQSSTAQLTDRYGNYIKPTPSFTYNGKTATGIEDNVGRKIFLTAGDQANELFYYQLGVGGEPIKWTVREKPIYVRREYQTTANAGIRERGGSSTQILQTYFDVLDEIILPSQLGGQKYEFGYSGSDTELTSTYSSGWGELNSITMPSGALAEYEYRTTIENTDKILGNSVKKKTLTYNAEYDGSSNQVQDIWNYNIGDTGATVTSPDGGTMTQTHFTSLYKLPLNGHVRKIENADGSKVEKLWSTNPTPWGGVNSFVKAEFSSITNSSGSPTLTAIKEFAQDKNGNTTSVKEYDFVPYANVPRDAFGYVTGLPSGINPNRTTITAYNNSTPDSSDVSTNGTYAYWNFSAIKGVAASNEVRNASNQPVTRTEITYDNYSTTANPTLTKVWDSFKGGSSQAYSNPLTMTNSISSAAVYDTYGNPTVTTDANGVNTTITYGAVGGYSGLYPTQVETASNFSTLKRTSTATYDFISGVVTTSTDVDNNLTNATEYDDLGQPTKAITAQGTAFESWTTTEYDVTNRRVTVRSDLETKADGKKVATQFVDQLGRVRLSKSLENAATQSATNETDGIKVQTRYTISGGYSYGLTSNPYRANYSFNETDPTMGWSRTKTVNTGRQSQAETFTGAGLPAPWGTNISSTGIVSTDIDGERTLVTDQAGKQRISKTSALGHLTDVWEVKASDASTVAVSFPGTGIGNGYQTSYAYDTLNNLTTVSQGSQTRTFGYSSLSRLKNAANPESGTINYTYDPNGNLIGKVDARSISTAYVYDALNRVTQRNYSGGTPTTPNVTYTYDNLTNAKGKLIKVASSISTTEYTSFDILGRVTASKQITDGVTYGNGSTDSLMTYKYSLGGALIEQQYPSGRVVKNTLDSSGDLSMVQSKKNVASGYWSYADSFSYNAAGAMTSLQLGNGKWESTTFNSRMQPTQIALGTLQNGTDKLKLDFTYGTTSNNGNVLTQTITVPGMTYPLVQTYAYDALNRLDDANETSNNTQTWRQDFTFDRYGNRNFVEGNTTMPGSFANPAVSNPAISTINNRITSAGFLFDTAGNTTRDAAFQTFTYDADNKQTEVKNPSSVVLGQYSYDGDGKRVKKYVPASGETTVFVYDAAGKSIAEYSTIVEPVVTAKVAYLTNDHLGSPRINTDANGNVISRHDYHPYGEEISTPQRIGQGYTDDTVRQQFTGYERDDESGLDFAEARMFGSSLGRFTSPDDFSNDTHVSDPQSWNLYTYVRNNPYRYVDRNGKDLVVVVNGKDYKVGRNADNGTYELSNNDGSNQVVKDSAAIINRFGSRFSTELNTLINGSQTSIMNIDGDPTRPNLPTRANFGIRDPRDGPGLIVTSTTSDVGISGNDDASLISIGTELLSANGLLTSTPFQQTSQNGDGSLAMTSQGGVNNAIFATEGRRQDMEDRVRTAFNLGTIDRGRTRWDQRLSSDFDPSLNPIVRPQVQGAPGISLPRAPVIDDDGPPPPRIRPIRPN